MKLTCLLLALCLTLPAQAAEAQPDALVTLLDELRYPAGNDDPMLLAIALASPRNFGIDAAAEPALEAALSPSASDNQWFSLLLATRAGDRGDAAAVDALLAQGADAPVFDSGRKVALRRMLGTHANASPVKPDGTVDLAFINALARSVTVAAVPPAVIARHCVDRQAPAARMALCGRFAEQWLARGDTVVDRFAALLILEKLPTDDAARLRAQQLRFHWRQAQAGPLMAALKPGHPAAMKAFYVDVVALGEAQAVDALISRNGIALDPPADWVPPPATEG